MFPQRALISVIGMIQIMSVSSADNRPFIIGGDLVTNSSQFPFLVRIGSQNRTSSSFLCGGSIYNSSTVISAAHCFQEEDKDLESFQIVAGCLTPFWLPVPTTFDSATKMEGDECQIRNLTKDDVMIHPGYNQNTKQNDIALIRISPPFNLNSNIQPLPIFEKNVDDYNGVNCIVAGWGCTEFENICGHLKLHSLNVTVRSPTECKYEDFNFNKATQICSGSDNGMTCIGDSGSPLFCSLQSGGPVFHAGVVSFGPKFCATIMPTVFTHVRANIDWIEGRNNDCPNKEERVSPAGIIFGIFIPVAIISGILLLYIYNATFKRNADRLNYSNTLT